MSIEMNKQPPITIYTDDEINIYQQWLIIKKRAKLISIVTFLCLLIIISYIIITPNIYRSSFVLQTDVISPFQIKIYIENISNLIKNKEYDILSSQLKTRNIDTVKKITASIPRGQKNLVIVTLKLLNPQKITIIEQKLLTYLNNQPEIKNIINIRKIQLQENISILKQQIKNLIQLKHKIINNKIFINNTSIKIDPLQIELSIQNCKDQIIQAQTELKNLQAVSLAVDAIIPKKPYWPRVKILIAIALVGGLFFSIFLAFFLEWIENAKKRFEEENKNK